MPGKKLGKTQKVEAEKHVDISAKKAFAELLCGIKQPSFTPARKAEIKELYLKELYAKGGQVHLALESLCLIAPQTLYDWREADKEFDSKINKAREFIEKRDKEFLAFLGFQVLRGETKLNPALYTFLMFQQKVHCGYSDQPNAGVTNIHIDMPNWLRDKVEARKVSDGLRTSSSMSGDDK